MLFYIIRHGKPDYKTNTLLPEGKAQAELAAKRLSKRKFKAIYSSPYGRAVETARPLSEKLGLSIQIEDWAYELGEESKCTLEDGTKELLSHLPGTYYHQEKFLGLSVGESFHRVDMFTPSFKERYENIAAGVDSLLARHGYSRNEAGTYDVIRGNSDRIALFCHGGMERVMLSHIFHIPYQFLAQSLQVPFTGITVLYFPEKPEDGPLKADNTETENRSTETDAVMPVIYMLGDIGHLSEEADLCRHYISGEVL